MYERWLGLLGHYEPVFSVVLIVGHSFAEVVGKHKRIVPQRVELNQQSGARYQRPAVGSGVHP